MIPTDVRRKCQAAIERSRVLKAHSLGLITQSQDALHATKLILADVAHIKGYDRRVSP